MRYRKEDCNMPANENIRKIREAKGVTKTFIAKSLGLTLQGYRHIEDGDVKLDVERMKVIAHVLGVESAIFLDDKLTESVIKGMHAA